MLESGWYIRRQGEARVAHYMAPADDADTHRSFLISLCKGEFDPAEQFKASIVEGRCRACELLLRQAGAALRQARSTESKP